MATQRKSGKEEIVERLRAALRLSTKNEAETLFGACVSCLEDTLIAHLAEDGYYIKLNSFGKFFVHHRPPIRRKIGFSGEVREIPPRRKVKFIGLGKLRQLKRGPASHL